MKVLSKKTGLYISDLIIIWLSIMTAYQSRFISRFHEWGDMEQMWRFCVVATICFGVSLYSFGLYRRLWKYASVGEMIAIAKAVVVGGLASYLMMFLLFQEPLPLHVIIRTLETILLLVGGIRFIWRIASSTPVDDKERKKNIVIYGAGDCGTLIAKEIMNTHPSEMKIVGFIDDNLHKYKLHVLGKPVLGDRHKIAQIASKHNIQEIIIAIPSATKAEVSEIVNVCKVTGAKLRMIPSLNDFVTGNVSLNKLRDVSVEDLLGREPISIDLDGIMGFVQNKVVLVTGAGGSIGSELCRQISAFHPEKLLLLGHGENSIYNIEMELRSSFPQVQLVTIIADIQDRTRMDDVFRGFAPHVVFHAAAHKHVPLMERNPSEAVKNNVLGTKNIADCADKYQVERFVLISSDKAVNPTSIMGATKRIAEIYIQSMDARSRTKFVTVRFGNVLGSRGSVIPLFKRQIAEGGPVTVTHPDMVRYFMTIPEAVQLVLQAGSFANGGEIFVLDMGDPVRILTLAEDLIRLSGFEPYEEIKVAFSGIREGEKLYEELLTDEENVTKTEHNRIFIGQSSHFNQSEVELQIKRLEKSLSEGQQSLREVIEILVPMYDVVS